MRMELASSTPAGQPAQPGAPLRLATPSGGAAGGDFWDVGNPGVVGQQLSPDHGFSDVVAVRQEGFGLGKMVLYLCVALLLAIPGYFAYQMLVNEKDPREHAKELYAQFLEMTGLGEPPVEAPVARPRARPVVVKAVPKKKSGTSLAGNPYWSLPNKMLGKETELNRTWTAEEEETWRAGLAHKFTYQRYKTVLEVRQRLLKGSEAILWDALQDKKMWTRGFAAVGIAEFNVEISLQSLETAIGKARSELVADFFERFIKKPNPGQAFVLRQVVRLLDEKGRLIALRGIANSKDDLRELYLAAATQDPGRHVRRWASNYLFEHPMNPDHYNDLIEVVSGERDGSYLTDGIGPTKADPKGKKKALHLATDEDLDKELAEFEKAGGDVEIYDEEGPQGEKTDPDTFEYQDAQGTKPLGTKVRDKAAPAPKSGTDGVEATALPGK